MQSRSRLDKSASAASVKPPRPGVRDSKRVHGLAYRHGAEVTGTMGQNGKRAGGYSGPWSTGDGRGPGSSLNGKLECRIMSEKRKQNSGRSPAWPSFLTLFPEMMPMH